jgi:cysteine dioxygenase
MPTKTLVRVEELVQQLRRCTEQDFTNIAAIGNILRENPVDPESIQRYLIWDRQHYTRNLIEKTPLFELMAICWEVGQESSVHNHQDQNCWMAAPIGRLQVQNYRVLREDQAAGTCDLRPTDVVEINRSNPVAVDPAEPVHKVSNLPEYRERAVSLHVYSRPFDHCMVYSAEQHKCGEIALHYNSEYGAPTPQG